MAKRYLKFAAGVAVDGAVFDDAGIPANWPDRAAYVESPHPIGSTLVNGVVIPPPDPVPPPQPTPQELADQLNGITASVDRTELALRAVVSLIADQLAITDAQAKTAVKNRMKAIAEGTRG